ncbi:hypothetical protein N173_15400 [Acinetobacter baumannii EGD-HP18]|jgi:hypothetical protein|uniref:Transposase n=1 Tax=Acinetobacter baumannii EGD-HP18 TaxID=1358412 RepID=A0AAV3K1M9_ACIBA|nr:hypothetical protein N173_15400 [Acinetobacter baumannii EGD-HP18]
MKTCYIGFKSFWILLKQLPLLKLERNMPWKQFVQKLDKFWLEKKSRTGEK